MPARLKKIPLTIFQRFFRTETLGSLVLLGFGLAALAIANSPLSEAYHHVWEIPLTLGIAPHELSLSLHDWINDGLMAVFFLLVGLEIKRELLASELSSARQAAIGAKVLLTALAIVDDMGAVLVISLFYSQGIVWSALVGAAVTLLVLIGFNLIGIRRLWPYLLVGVVLWCV